MNTTVLIKKKVKGSHQSIHAYLLKNSEAFVKSYSLDTNLNLLISRSGKMSSIKEAKPKWVKSFNYDQKRHEELISVLLKKGFSVGSSKEVL